MEGMIYLANLWEDLRRMNKAIVDKEAKTVTAQGGCKMAQLESAAYEEGLAIVTGIVNETGKEYGRFEIFTDLHRYGHRTWCWTWLVEWSIRLHGR
jgi:hypothetical protein